MTIHVTPIPSTIVLVAPDFTLGGSNAAGSATTAVASNSTIASVFSANVDIGSHLLVGNDGSSGIAISANGEVTMPVQPSFFTRLDSSIDNVTGDGTAYVIDWEAAEVDRGGDFDDVSTFTAPVTGIYRFSGAVGFNDLSASHTRALVHAVAANGVLMFYYNPYVVMNAAQGIGSFPLPGTLIDMDADDTITISVTVNGGSKAVDIWGSSSASTYWGGELVA